MPELIAILHKLRIYSTYLLAVFFLLPVNWVSYLIGLWALIQIIPGIISYKKIKKTDLYNILLYTAPFIILTCSIALHGGGGGSVMEKAMSFFVFPICIFISTFTINKHQLYQLTWVFLIGCCVLALKSIVMYLIIAPHFPYGIEHDFIFRYRSEFIFNTHISPTYACIYFAFALLLVLLQFAKFKNKKGIVLLLSCFVLLNMLMLSAKMPIVAFGILGIVLLLKKQILVNWMNLKKRIWVVLIVIVPVALSLTFTRWNEIFTSLHYKNTDVVENSVGIRKGIFKCAIELSGEYYLLGAGPQHTQKKLNECYYQFEGNDFERQEFNTHNQYLDSLISNGIIGLLVLLLVLAIPLYNSIRHNDPFLFSFVILVALCMLTENILSRQAGIVFYAFFNSLLVNRLKEPAYH